MVILIILFILIIVIFVWLNYLLYASPNKISYTIGFNKKSYDISELFNGNIDHNLVLVDEYAELNNIVYRRDGYENKKSFKNWKKLPIPKINVLPKIKTQKKLEGLHYEIWGNKINSSQPIVAIVFRGTNSKNDWITNFRWIRRVFDSVTWDHYDQLNQIGAQIVCSINEYHKKLNGKIKIISLGHSLGGGLAQFMAYSNPEIKQVYAFNSSPVTGYYDIKPAQRKRNTKDVKIYRIHESGEILAFARNFMKIIYPAPWLKVKNPVFIRIRFSCTSVQSAGKQHSIKQFAECLSKLKADFLNKSNSLK